MFLRCCNVCKTSDAFFLTNYGTEAPGARTKAVLSQVKARSSAKLDSKQRNASPTTTCPALSARQLLRSQHAPPRYVFPAGAPR